MNKTANQVQQLVLANCQRFDGVFATRVKDKSTNRLLSQKVSDFLSFSLKVL